MICTKCFIVPAAGSLVVALASSVASAGLLSHFTFDRDFTNAANAALDSPSQEGATIDNAVARVGGGSVRFDGGDVAEYVNAGEAAVPGIQGAFLEGTIALWFKAAPNTATANRALMGQTNGNPATFGADNRNAFVLETDGSGKLRMFIRSADGAESNNRLRYSHDSADAADYLRWADGEWRHLAYAWSIDSMGASLAKIYIDGEAVPTVIQENSLEDNAITSLIKAWEPPGMYIGAQNNRTFQGGPGASGHVNGWIDDLRVYDEVLSAAQIQALATIPEPTSLALGAAVAALAGLRRQRGR
jgi:hypothetical protein